jgi:hypothetical protein
MDLFYYSTIIFNAGVWFVRLLDRNHSMQEYFFSTVVFIFSLCMFERR